MKKTSRTVASTNPTREDRLARYCVAGAAAIAGAVTTADASVVFTNYNNQTFTDTTPGDTSFTLFNFDIDRNGTTDVQIGQRNGLAAGTGGGAIIVAPTGGTLGVIGIYSSGYNYAARLAAGANIGPSAAFLTLAGVGFSARASLASNTGFPLSQWASPSPSVGYLGLRFTGVGGVTEYAYLHLSIASNTAAVPRQITLLDGAYENTGAALSAVAVPEPSSLALIALGSAGLAAYRRRAKSKMMTATSETAAV